MLFLCWIYVFLSYFHLDCEWYVTPEFSCAKVVQDQARILEILISKSPQHTPHHSQLNVHYRFIFSECYSQNKGQNGVPTNIILVEEC